MGRMRNLLLLLIALIVCSVAFVKHKDQDNRFCISCHLHQEHYRGMVEAPPATLAAAHYGARSPGHPERCFTCHSGEGVVGWSLVTLLSAWDAARWVAGDRRESTSMRLPLTNTACLKCHAADVRGHRSEEETSKYHELINHRDVRLACVTCHVTHRRGEESKVFLDDGIVRAACRGCHRSL
jgi:hypothetical protein